MTEVQESRLHDLANMIDMVNHPVLYDETPTLALGLLLGISPQEVTYLLDAISYKQPTNHNVSRRIRSLVRLKTKRRNKVKKVKETTV